MAMTRVEVETIPTFGEQLSAIMRSQDLTIDRLAERSGLSPYTLGEMLKNRYNGNHHPTMLNIIKICNALGIRAFDFKHKCKGFTVRYTGISSDER
jgi:transcriptional regulator with XRE-family HTH domain